MQTKNKQTRSHALIKILIGWAIILFSYLAIRAVFFTFGFTSVRMLGIALAIIPYLLATLYFMNMHGSYGICFYSCGVLLAAVTEKILLYFFGAFLYDINPMKVNYVFEAMKDRRLFINLFPQPSARSIFELSFMGEKYILGSIFFSIVLVFVLNRVNKKQMS